MLSVGVSERVTLPPLLGSPDRMASKALNMFPFRFLFFFFFPPPFFVDLICREDDHEHTDGRSGQRVPRGGLLIYPPATYCYGAQDADGDGAEGPCSWG